MFVITLRLMFAWKPLEKQHAIHQPEIGSSEADHIRDAFEGTLESNSGYGGSVERQHVGAVHCLFVSWLAAPGWLTR